MRQYFMTLCLVLAALTTGCAQKAVYTVKVDAIASTDAAGAGKRYILLPLGDGVTPDDLQFQEYARQINAVLAQKGYSPASTPAEANQVILLGYGISAPQQNIGTTSTPIIGQTGVLQSNTYGTYQPATGTFSATTTNTPMYGVTGTATSVYTYNTYTRSITLGALEVVQKDKPTIGKQLWKTSVVSTGAEGDLRKVFPVLVMCLKNYVCTNPGQAVTFDVNAETLAIKPLK